MAKIPTFDARAPERGSVQPSTDTGAADAWFALARASGRFADQLFDRAAVAARREGQEAGTNAALAVKMPGVDFAFSGAPSGSISGPAQGIVRAAAARHGVSGAYLDRLAMVESSGNPNAVSSTGAEGPFQFTGGTAKQYGLANRRDWGTSADAAARLTADNRNYLRNALGREPTPGELYLAHQQGAGGAAVLLANPTASAASVVGEKAIMVNGGRAGMTAGQFASMWTKKFADLDETGAGVAPGPTGPVRGLIQPGNIDLANRPIVKNDDGTISTVRSMSFEEDGKEILIPTVSPDGKILSDQAAIDLYHRTGQHLGIFDNARDATVYATDLHKAQATFYSSASATKSTSPRVTLTGAPEAVPQMKPGTIRADAYNRAAIDIHVNRLNTAMQEQMSAIGLEHAGDPSGMATALDALKGGYIDASSSPAERAMIEDTFQRTRFGLIRGAAKDYGDQLKAQNAASFEDAIDARRTNVMRIASKGGTDPEADAMLGKELDSLDADIDASPLSPLEKQKRKHDLANDVFGERIKGGFDALTDPAARTRYVAEFQHEWQDGKGFGGKLDPEAFDKVNAGLVAGVKADEAAAAKRGAEIDKSIDQYTGYLKKGWPVPADTRKALTDKAAATGDPALIAQAGFLGTLADWQSAHIASRPEVIDAQIAQAEARVEKDGATPAALTALDVMHGLRDSMAKGLATDPLTWANRAGVANVQPLDFSDGEHLTASLSERVVAADAVARHYGIQAKYFTPNEADALKKVLQKSPLSMPSLVSALDAGLGNSMPKAMAEISKDAPVLAHVAGLEQATGSDRVAIEVAEALDMRGRDGYKSALPEPARLANAAAEDTAGAFAALPGTVAGALQTASALFERRLAARGITAADFSTAGSPSRLLFDQALDEVLGATTRNGIKYGGLTEINGQTTIAPADLPADSLQDMLSDMSGADLAKQPAMGTANGVPITLSQLRAGKLVMVGDGRYRVALGDIAAGDPRYVPGANGGYFELDMRALAKSRAARPVDTHLPTVKGNFR